MTIKKITTNAISDNAVTSAKVQDGQVTASDIASNAVTTAKLDSAGIAPVITGGTINGAVVGGTTPAAGSFTTLNATSIDNTPIGGTTPAAGNFSTFSLSADTVQSSEGGTGQNFGASSGYVKFTSGTASVVADPLADGTTKLALSRGGLNADVSAYNGLVRINSGTASAVSLPLSIDNGGTGTNTQAGALNALLPSQVGANGKVLASDGANASWQLLNGGAWVFLSSVTANNSATVDVETTFDSTYDAYVIVITNGKVGTDAVGISCRMKISGSYVSDANYAYYLDRSASGTFASQSNAAISEIPLLTDVTSDAGGGFSFELLVNNPSGSSHKSAFWSGMAIPKAGNIPRSGRGQGVYRSTSALTGMRFYATSGNIASGTFRLYGIKNS